MSRSKDRVRVPNFVRCVLIRSLCCVFACLSGVSAENVFGEDRSDGIEWSGRGKFRLLVTVPSVPLNGRASDVSVASLPVKFSEWVRGAQQTGQFNPATLHVHRFNPADGKALPYSASVSKSDSRDLPCRFDDDGQFGNDQGRVGQASAAADGRPPAVNRPRRGRLFNREPASQDGLIVWTHTQSDDQPSHYAIYFDLMDSDMPLPTGPAPWLGDVDLLRRESGQSLGGYAHFTAATGDLTGDGLFDIVAGTEKGDIMWFVNHGTKQKPLFTGCQLLQDELGSIDSGWYGAPFITDWNSDGLPDLLIGASSNVILWWQNQGSATQPKFHYRGFVQADGKRLEVPQSPVAEDSRDIFKVDYYNQPWAGDMNQDGHVDIVTGGYTTGRIYLFAGTGRTAEGVPQLSAPVEVTADGQPIDTIWAAAPAIADVDADGLPDLVTGGWYWSGIHKPPGPGEADMLRYYHNVGRPEQPEFRREPFPGQGSFPGGTIARPQFVDINSDGLIDLLVSDVSGSVYQFLNVGTARKPLWNLSSESLTVPWGFVTGYDASAKSIDINRDGTPELLQGTTISVVEGGIHSPQMKALGIVKTAKGPIDHPGPGYGDPYYSTVLHDWDQDGWPDLLWGTHQGNIYVHRKNPNAAIPEFEDGELLLLTDGKPLKTGPEPVASADLVPDFTVLQGSRILFHVVDFDQDGIDDIVLTDTYRHLWFYRGVLMNGQHRVEPGVKMMKLRTESLVFTDWNQDGKPDLLPGGTVTTPAIVCLNQSTPGKPSLGSPEVIPGIPYVFWGPKVRVADWNQDGDEDLMIQGEFLSFWAERSFLTRGYSEARLVNDGQAEVIQQQPTQ